MSDMGTNTPFDNAAKTYELETARLTALANAQLTLMQAAKVGEEVHGLAITNEGRELALKRARNALHQLDAQRVEREREAKRLREHGNNLVMYVGQTLHTPTIIHQRIWAAYRVLRPASLAIVWAQTPIDSMLATAPESWYGGSYPNALYSLLELLNFQSEHETSALTVAGSYPWLRTVEAFQQINESYGSKVKALEEQISAIKANDVQALKLAELLK